uniref:G_PROTEIN_RECEP_F1_2 domain-containing protein n=1 Tax=Caenorhabditis tropicalis TaxID=1561998 RepID=A0A1I7U1K0_9PELO
MSSSKQRQKDYKNYNLQTLPCPTIEFFTEPILVLATEADNYMTTSCILIYLCLTLQIIFFTSCCIYYLFISKTISRVSQSTRRLQIRSFYLLVLQTFLPILLVTVPMMIFLNKSKDGEYDQVKNNVMFIAISVQNGSISLSILLVHKPYRSFLKSGICGKKEGNVASEISTRM